MSKQLCSQVYQPNIWGGSWKWCSIIWAKIQLITFMELASIKILETEAQVSHLVQFSSVQSLSLVRLFATPWIAAHQASLSIPSSWSSLKLMSIESVMPSSYLTLFHPLLLPPSIFPSIRVFSSESVLCIRWPKYGASASASGLPMNIQDWFPLRLTGLISLQSRGLSRVFSKTQFKSINSKAQFKSISSSMLSFLFSPTLTSVHDYWKNHRFD